MQDLQNYNVRKDLQNAYNIRTTNKAFFRITPSNGFERHGNDLSRPLTIGEAAPKGIETEIRPITTHNLTLFPGPCKRTHGAHEAIWRRRELEEYCQRRGWSPSAVLLRPFAF
jgi:hypothetical protein